MGRQPSLKCPMKHPTYVVSLWVSELQIGPSRHKQRDERLAILKMRYDQ